jgi:hypothetical protein
MSRAEPRVSSFVSSKCHRSTVAYPNTMTLEPNMKKTTSVLAALAIAASIGMSIAPPAAADRQ